VAGKYYSIREESTGKVPDVALLRVCRAIYQETKYFRFEIPEFRFWTLEAFKMFCEKLGHLERSAIKKVMFEVSYGVPDIWMVDDNAYDVMGCKMKQSPNIPSRQAKLQSETNAPKKDKKAAREQKKAEKKAEKKARKVALKEDKDYFKSSWEGKEFYRSLAHYLPGLVKIEAWYNFIENEYQLDKEGMDNGLLLFDMWLSCGYYNDTEVIHYVDEFTFPDM
jgi:hypothetical protein